MSAVLDLLRATTAGDDASAGRRLYGLVDAGRDHGVLTLLYSFDAPMRSLYEGDSEASLGPSGPYLVELTEQDDLLKALLRGGWGQAWGLFATSAGDFDEVRKHFRSLLMVKRQSDGSELYFRFYDPRVLRIFIPTCSAEQLPKMFGPIDAYFVESEQQQPLCFTLDDSRELLRQAGGDGDA